MVSIASLDFPELGRCLVAALAAGGVVWAAIWAVGRLPMQILHSHIPAHIRWTDLSLLMVGGVLWLAITGWTLEKTGSALPKVAMKQLGFR
jgi:putative peptidoglycan lipid II flippase